MPVYEYECAACGHQFEEWQKMSDKPVTICPKCQEEKVERLISATSFHLKGGGWYSDLYASKKSGSSGGGSSEGSGGGSGGGGGKEGGAKEPAPAAKTDKPAKKDSGTKTAAA